MRIAKHNSWKIATLALAIATTGGCVSAKMNPGDEAAMAAPAPEPEQQVAEPVAMETEIMSYTVVKNDNLWNISKQDQIYGTEYNWPLIYKANTAQITDADLIYPDQVLDIPRGSSQDEIDAAVNHAKMRGAWSLGPTEASDVQYLGG